MGLVVSAAMGSGWSCWTTGPGMVGLPTASKATCGWPSPATCAGSARPWPSIPMSILMEQCLFRFSSSLSHAASHVQHLALGDQQSRRSLLWLMKKNSGFQRLSRAARSPMTPLRRFQPASNMSVNSRCWMKSRHDHEFLIDDVLCLATSSGKIRIGFDVTGAAATFTPWIYSDGFANRVRSIELGPAKKQVVLLNFRRPIIHLKQELRLKDDALIRLEENLQNLETEAREERATLQKLARKA